MKMLLLIPIICLTMVSCTYSDIDFERMSEIELAAYNETQPLSQMIICSEESRTFSRVRRRSCATVGRLYESEEQAAQLEVLNTVPGIGVSAGDF